MLILIPLLADTKEGWTVHYYVAIAPEDSKQYYTPQPEEPNPRKADGGISSEHLNGALTLYNTNGNVESCLRQVVFEDV